MTDGENGQREKARELKEGTGMRVDREHIWTAARIETRVCTRENFHLLASPRATASERSGSPVEQLSSCDEREWQLLSMNSFTCYPTKTTYCKSITAKRSHAYGYLESIPRERASWLTSAVWVRPTSRCS